MNLFPWYLLIFLKRSLVFPSLFFPSISLHWLLRKNFLSLLAILCNSAFKWVYLSFSPLPLASLLFSAIRKPPQTAILPFCISFSLGWSWSLPPVQCHEALFLVLQAFCLSDLMPWIYLSLPLYNHKARECFYMQYWVPIKITHWVFVIHLDMYQVLLYSLYHFKSYKNPMG